MTTVRIEEEAMEAAREIVDGFYRARGFHIDWIVPRGVKVAFALLAITKERDEMREALTSAAEQFEFYAREHRTKANNLCSVGRVGESNAAIEKARTNEHMAAVCRAALSPSNTED